MVEKAVNLVYKYVYAPLRNQRFTSLSEINYYFRIQLDQLNSRNYKGSSFSRRDQRNCHIQIREDRLYYSVPWQYVGSKVKVWYDQQTVEIYDDYQSVALHIR